MAGRTDRAFLAGYVQPEHVVMREVSAAIQAATGADLSRAPRGIDGCSIPTYAIPLRRLAHGFARAGTGVGLRPGHAAAAARLRRAVARAPLMVAGSGRFDTRVMQSLGERVFCKVGAEGMYCAALPDAGLGVAIKIDDGNNARACEVAMAAVIQALVPLREDRERVLLAELSKPTLRSRRDAEVGRLAAHETLQRLLPSAKPRKGVTHCRRAALRQGQNGMNRSPMSPPNHPPPFQPSAAGGLDFQAVSLDSARAALDELPSGVARALDAMPGYWQKNRRLPLPSDRALTGRAMDWSTQLPENVRPLVTAERYPRI
jgi:hypothetical protein